MNAIGEKAKQKVLAWFPDAGVELIYRENDPMPFVCLKLYPGTQFTRDTEEEAWRNAWGWIQKNTLALAVDGL